MEYYRIIVTGVVQGIGFRPFLFNLLNNYKPSVAGTIRNSGNLGVVIDICTHSKKFSIFTLISLIKQQSPPMAFIEFIKQSEVNIPDTIKKSISQMDKVQIVSSGDLTGKTITLPPDIAMCNDCLKEFNDPHDRRRANYEFISCVKCGPRFTIMRSLPYDRIRSTMDEFPFCEECNEEYNDPDDPRFHAQTFCCNQCGPFYYIYHDKKVPKYPKPMEIEVIVEELRKGNIIALKGIGGVNLICRADSFKTIQKLRDRKKDRKYKPFAVMVPDIDYARSFVEISKIEEELLVSYRRPIVLCTKKQKNNLIIKIPKNIAPGMPNIGIILPYTGIHYLLFKKLGKYPLIFTSGNSSHLPMAIDNETIQTLLSPLADQFYLHNRKIYQRCDDSVIRSVSNIPTVLRRSRGYVPEYIRLPFIPKYKAMIAVGAQLNSTGSVIKGDRIFPTQHIGNIQNLETYSFLESAIIHMKTLLKIEDTDVQCIVRDLHPLFQSTRLANNLSQIYKKASTQAVPHHHAHLASLLVDHSLSPYQKIIAITIDGVGYGEDKEPWGGEILLGDMAKFQRIGHLKSIPMIGGDLCAKQPFRMLLCILFNSKKCLGKEDPIFEELIKIYPPDLTFPHGKMEYSALLTQLENYYIKKKSNTILNTPKTSSLGRILDAIAALFGLCFKRTYRGEPAMRLEGFIWNSSTNNSKNHGKYCHNNIIQTNDLLWDYTKQFLALKNQKESPSNLQLKTLARELFEILSHLIAKCAIENSIKLKIPYIGVSGGVAYNDILIRIIKNEVEQEEIEFLQHHRIPPGDAGISIGQAAVAAYKDLIE